MSNGRGDDPKKRWRRASRGIIAAGTPVPKEEYVEPEQKGETVSKSWKPSQRASFIEGSLPPIPGDDADAGAAAENQTELRRIKNNGFKSSDGLWCVNVEGRTFMVPGLVMLNSGVQVLSEFQPDAECRHFLPEYSAATGQLQFYLPRRASAFGAVLMYLHGEGLHMPTELCAAAWHDELRYYGLAKDTPMGCMACHTQIARAKSVKREEETEVYVAADFLSHRTLLARRLSKRTCVFSAHALVYLARSDRCYTLIWWGCKPQTANRVESSAKPDLVDIVGVGVEMAWTIRAKLWAITDEDGYASCHSMRACATKRIASPRHFAALVSPFADGIFDRCIVVVVHILLLVATHRCTS